MPAEAGALRILAERAARRGGEIGRAAFGTRPELRFKPDRSEVTAIDLAAERAVIGLIRSERPQDAFIAEERTAGADGPHPDAAQICWAIDPVDGTRNFVRGIPLFACSVAALRDGTPIAGAIFDPLHDALYSADAHGPLLVNGRSWPELGAADADGYRASARVLAAIPSLPHRRFLPAVHRMIERFVVRTYGSAAMHLAWIATGRIDAALQDNPKLWDVAAGWLLVQRAGGVVTRTDGQPLFPIDLACYGGEDLPLVAGAPAAQADLLSIVRSAVSGAD